jgi:hypothetical protein
MTSAKDLMILELKWHATLDGFMINQHLEAVPSWSGISSVTGPG